MNDDLVDEFYVPFVQPLGNMVVLFAQAEASLLSLVALLMGIEDEREAQNTLKSKDQVLELARKTPELQDSYRSELCDGIEAFWADKERRNRYIPDEWYPSFEDGMAATRGLPLKKGADIAYDAPTPEQVWALAASFREHDRLFSYCSWAIRKQKPTEGDDSSL